MKQVLKKVFLIAIKIFFSNDRYTTSVIKINFNYLIQYFKLIFYIKFYFKNFL